MAGYIFNVGKDGNIKEMFESGYYSTFINSLSPTPFEGTFADYVSMNVGDNVYFFKERKLYGIGKMVNVGKDCKYNNYIGASKLKNFSYKEIQESLIVDFGSLQEKYRWICFFEEGPVFMEKGLDMDEILQYKPDSFKGLRTNWKRTFIKIDDEENKALKELFYLRVYNQSANYKLKNDLNFYKDKITEKHLLDSKDLIENSVTGLKLAHEMAVEATTIAKIKLAEKNIFGKWDYITHQMCASPFKPVDYMDKMDIFAYKFTEIDNEKVISKYMVIEIKKDSANKDTIAQVTNYVDWICTNYAYGDYSLIEAYILAYDFNKDVLLAESKEMYERTYNLGSHPIQVKKWSNLKFIKYKIVDGDIEYEDVTPYEIMN